MTEPTPERNTDLAIARLVVGAQAKEVMGTLWEHHPNGSWNRLPYYSTDIAAIWPLHATQDWLLHHDGGRWFVYEHCRAMEDGLPLGTADTAPLAICTALLKALK